MNAAFIDISCDLSLCPDAGSRYAAKVTHYVDSEVGQLGTVLLHRPGPELARLTPRNNDSLLFDGIPWVGRAQEEHDIFADALRSTAASTVLYLADLLTEVLAIGAGAQGADRGGARRRTPRRQPAPPRRRPPRRPRPGRRSPPR